MGEASGPYDTSKFINPAQVGGIEPYTIDDGEGRGSRVLCVNTGGGLRYRVLIRVRGPRGTESWFEAMVSGPAST